MENELIINNIVFHLNNIQTEILFKNNSKKKIFELLGKSEKTTIKIKNSDFYNFIDCCLHQIYLINSDYCFDPFTQH